MAVRHAVPAQEPVRVATVARVRVNVVVPRRARGKVKASVVAPVRNKARGILPAATRRIAVRQARAAMPIRMRAVVHVAALATRRMPAVSSHARGSRVRKTVSLRQPVSVRANRHVRVKARVSVKMFTAAPMPIVRVVRRRVIVRLRTATRRHMATRRRVAIPLRAAIRPRAISRRRVAMRHPADPVANVVHRVRAVRDVRPNVAKAVPRPRAMAIRVENSAAIRVMVRAAMHARKAAMPIMRVGRITSVARSTTTSAIVRRQTMHRRNVVVDRRVAPVD